MNRLDARSLERLDAMGIPVWHARQSRSGNDQTAIAEDEAAQEARIRLSSGDGDWLLVQRQPWRGDHQALLADIMATLGTGRCRFGQWTRDSASGEAGDELSERGVRHILSFGAPQPRPAWSSLLIAPELDELARDSQARKTLWRLIAPQLEA
jgi:hypothetical protein